MIWGNPHRGRVQGGVLQLPGEKTRSVTQPGGAYDEAGNTYLQRGPRALAQRTPEEIAADALLGRTWRTDAIISGSTLDLYGKRLGGWVYCAPDGTRWLISMPSWSLTPGQPLAGTVTASRFGDIPGIVDMRPLNVSLADIGQAEPDPAYPIAGPINVALSDITPDGSRALLMLCKPAQYSRLHKLPLGWLELTISGGAADLAASVAVARTRTQAIGPCWKTFAPTPGGSMAFPGDSMVETDMGDYVERVYTPQSGFAETGYSFLFWNGGNSSEIGFSARILAMWYDASGMPLEATLAFSLVDTVESTTPSESISGQRVTHYIKATGVEQEISDTRHHTVSRTCGASSTLSLQLKVGSTVIDSLSASGSGTASDERDLVAGTRSANWTESGSVDGTAYNNPRSSTAHNDYLAPPSSGVGAYYRSINDGALGIAIDPAEIGASSINRFVLADAVRYSNNLLAMLRTNSSPSSSMTVGPSATPAGALGQEEPYAGQYGSYNPATGEVARNQTTPVCWI